MKRYFTAALCIFINLTSSFSQTLSVNTSQLSFGNVYDDSPDSLPLNITNTIGRDVTVTGIKFYNIYGSPAFSASSTWFTIVNGNTSTIWIKFSPLHNIFHNTEMVIENDGLRGSVSIDLLGQGKYSDHYYDLTENQSEENLKTAINQVTGTGYVSLGYNVARDSMFMSLDNQRTNGQGASQNTLECVYTGRLAVGYTDRSDCQTTFSFNTEHTLPQSLFTSMEPMKSDLHHLFPTDDVANNQRGDNPFGVVTNPSWSNGGSSTDGTIFEPRDQHKGEVARALFYFVLRYQNYSNFLNSQESILKTWHKAFPVNPIEWKRNNDIYSMQHNRNPFIDHPVLIDRITSVSTTSVAPVISEIDLVQDTIIYGTIAPSSPVVFDYVVVNDGNTNINLTNFALTHSAELSFASTGHDTTIAPGESLTLKIRCLTSTTDSIRAFLSFNTDAAGNASVIVPIFVNDLVFSAINEITAGIRISPIPAHEKLNISLENSSSFISYTMYDITGKIVGSSQLKEKDSTIDVSDLMPGVYILKVICNGTVIERKIIKQ